jgi:predicted PhzF superfamily epimerase YddE/YHI9
LITLFIRRRPSSISHGKDQWFELEIDIDIQTDGKKFQCFIVDAFADPNKIGTGNPAAVVILDTSTLKQRNMVNDEQSLVECTTQWMQTIANEFNLSETAFIWPRQNKYRDDTSNDGILSYNIRYFTPTVEVALCGHATLASSSVLFQKELEQNPNTAMVRSCTVEFHTIGNLALKTNLASFVENRTDIEMSLPSLDTQEINSSNERQIITQMLSNAVGIDSESILFLGIADEIDDLLVEVTYESFMQIPYTGIDYSAFLIWKGSSRGVIISCLGTSTTGVKMDTGIDFYSRFFGPACGIDEDPVTGSAHCALVPYYSKRLDGKRSMLAYQKSKRGGLIQCLLSDNTKLVKLTGTAINAVTGTLCW